MLMAIVDTPQRHQDLTVFPVISSDGPTLHHLLLAEALTSGLLTINVARTAGGPRILTRNDAWHSVLILGGERLTGTDRHCRTDRTVLVGPRTTADFPLALTSPETWDPPQRNGDLARCLKHFPLMEAQIGILAFLGRQFLGMEALGSPNLYAPLHSRLMGSMLEHVLSRKGPVFPRPLARESEALAMADALERADRVPRDTLGEGRFWTLEGSVRGSELTHEGHLVHLSVSSKRLVA